MFINEEEGDDEEVDIPGIDDQLEDLGEDEEDEE